jgi:nicotinamide phosphoribosyltransferase
MSANGKEGEFDTFKELLKKYPTGILSIVSDTYDYYNVIDNYLVKLKEDILSRDGKLVIRPDSGVPIEICLNTLNKL